MVKESETREGFLGMRLQQPMLTCFSRSPVSSCPAIRTRSTTGTCFNDRRIGRSDLAFFYHYRSALGRVLVIALALDLLYSGFTRMRSPDEKQWGSYGMYADFFDPATSAVYQSNQELALGDGPYAMVLRYGNSALRRRSFYPVYKRQGDNWVISQIQLDMRDYDELRRLHRSFLLFDPEWWMVPQMVKDGADVEIKAFLTRGPLYSVSFK